MPLQRSRQYLMGTKARRYKIRISIFLLNSPFLRDCRYFPIVVSFASLTEPLWSLMTNDSRSSVKSFRSLFFQLPTPADKFILLYGWFALRSNRTSFALLRKRGLTRTLSSLIVHMIEASLPERLDHIDAPHRIASCQYKQERC
jgi:hypothetical protein